MQRIHFCFGQLLWKLRSIRHVFRNAALARCCNHKILRAFSMAIVKSIYGLYQKWILLQFGYNLIVLRWNKYLTKSAREKIHLGHSHAPTIHKHVKFFVINAKFCKAAVRNLFYQVWTPNLPIFNGLVVRVLSGQSSQSQSYCKLASVLQRAQKVRKATGHSAWPADTRLQYKSRISIEGKMAISIKKSWQW